MHAQVHDIRYYRAQRYCHRASGRTPSCLLCSTTLLELVRKVYNLHLHTSMRKSTVNHATKKSPQLQTTTASRRRGHEKESHVVELLEKRLKKIKQDAQQR